MTATANSGCTQTTSIEVLEDTEGTPDFSLPAVDLSCIEESVKLVPEIFSNYSNVTWEGPGINDTNRNELNPSVSLAGTYLLTVTSQNGCQTTKSVQVGEAPNFDLSIEATHNISCFGMNDGSISLKTSLTPSEIQSIVWNDGSSEMNRTNLSKGTYQVVITNIDGCYQQTNIEITEPEEIKLSLDIKPVTSPGALNGSATLTSNKEASSIEWFFNGESVRFGKEAIYLEEGDYTIVFTDKNDCSKTITFTMGVKDVDCTSLNISFESTSPKCHDSEDGVIKLDISGANGDYTTTINSEPVNSNYIPNLPAGTYLITLNDVYGCSAEKIIELVAPDELKGTYSFTDNSCTETASLEANFKGGTMPYSYSWSTGETSVKIAPPNTGTYTVGVKDANGCIGEISEEFTISDVPHVQVQAGYSDVTCFEANNGKINLIILQGTAPFQYNWSDQNLTGQNVTDLVPGTYKVTIYDANDCSTETSVTIEEPTELIVELETAQGSNNKHNVSTTVNGGSLPYSYSWSNGANTATVEDLEPGSYTVTVTDSKGCTTIEAFEISGVGTNQISFIESFNLFPNPNSGKFELNIKAHGQHNWTLEIFNLLGAKVYTSKFHGSMLNQTINLNNITEGTYFLKLASGDESLERKLVILK